MKESIIYQIPHIYRDDFRVRAYTFGEGEKTLCIVGSMRGNEYQQIYLCSQMVQALKAWENDGRLIPGKQVMVIPSVNPSSMNIGKRFWGIDNTDINRMFPGYQMGETTQRIADGVFDVVNKYRFGVQFTSFYMPGEFQPHVRMMQTGFEDVKKAEDFGLPYIALRTPRPYDTTTLNYNWQIWETAAYSLYSATTDRIDPVSAKLVISGIERFMTCSGILSGTPSEVSSPRLIRYDDLINIRTEQAGLFQSYMDDSDHVEAGQRLAEILDPCSGEVLETLVSPAAGILFFRHNAPLIYAHTSAVKLLPDS